MFYYGWKSPLYLVFLIGLALATFASYVTIVSFCIRRLQEVRSKISEDKRFSSGNAFKLQLQELINTNFSKQKDKNFSDTSMRNAVKLLSLINNQIGNISEVTGGKLHERAIINWGSQNRLEFSFLKLLASKPNKRHLKFAATGGSITAEFGIPPGTGYFSLIEKWLSTALEPLNITFAFHNIAWSATDSFYYGACIHQHLNLPDYDVIFLEFSINDPFVCGATEDLVRSIWRKNPFIHIIYVHFVSAVNFFRVEASRVSRKPQRASHDCRIPVPYEEDTHLGIARFYNLPTIQTMHVYEKYVNASVAMEHLYIDSVHPNVAHHHFFAEFCLHYLYLGIRNLLSRLRASDEGTTVRNLISNEKTSIEHEWASFSKKMFNARFTVLDDSDCFLSLNRSFSKTQTLSNALADHSPDSGNVSFDAWMPHYVKPGHKIENETGFLFLPPKNGFIEFRFEANALRKQLPCKRYLPQLAFAYRACGGCGTGRFMVNATYRFADGTVLDTSHLMKLPAAISWPNLVAFSTFVPDVETICMTQSRTASINSLQIVIQQSSENYAFMFHGIIVAYRCCHNNTL